MEFKKTAPKHDGHHQVVDLLLNAGADPLMPGSYWHISALALCATGDSAEFLPALLKEAPDQHDISEFLAEIGMAPPKGAIERTVTYDEPCHLMHGQNVHDQPRQLLQSIPGLRFVELRESEWCCGSAGIYNITQPDMSKRILERKMKHIADTEAEIVATGNPGCILQIQLGLREHGLPMKVNAPG